VINSRKLEWAENVADVREMSTAYRDLMWKPEGNKSLARPRHRWKDTLKRNSSKSFGGAWTGFILTQN